MKIYISPYFFLFCIILTILNQIKVYLLIMIFAFIHEVFHLITGTILKFKPSSFSVLPIGFRIEFNSYLKKTDKKKIEYKKMLIILSGPTSNIIICILGILCKLNSNIIYANILLIIFNLIPIYPLDGARFLKCILKLKFNNLRVNQYINNISNITVIVLTIIFSILIFALKNICMVLYLFVMWYFTMLENKRYRLSKNVYKIIDKNNNYL